MMTRAELKQVQAMIDASRETPPENEPSATSASAASPAATSAPVDGPEALAAEPLAPMITIEEFQKVDLRVARVVAAEEVPKAKKLVRLTLSLGGDERRNVFAGIKSAYQPEQLVGRLVICVANLQPRQMTFGVSEGMVVASGGGGQEIYLLSPDSGAKPGQRVH
jgi:methionyl-tRNA synthetase